MGDDHERTISDTDTEQVPSRERADGERADETSTVEAAAESFLDIEGELADERELASGIAVDASRDPATSLPERYPLVPSSESVLALDVELRDGRTVTVYVEWDLDGELGQLLDGHDIEPEQFAALHGKQLRVRRERGHYRLVVPDSTSRGDPQAIYGLGVAFGVTLLGWLLVVGGFGGVLSAPLSVLAWLGIGSLGLPITTYLDAWHRRRTTDWDQGPLFWATLAAIPGVNVVSTLLYLYGRTRATRVG